MVNITELEAINNYYKTLMRTAQASSCYLYARQVVAEWHDNVFDANVFITNRLCENTNLFHISLLGGERELGIQKFVTRSEFYITEGCRVNLSTGGKIPAKW